MEKALVGNAADKKQVDKAKTKEKIRRDGELRDLFAILQAPEGRRFIWRLLTHCKVFESIWRSSAEIHRLAGQQDVGHFIMSEVVESNEEALFMMMKESKQREN